MANILDNLGGLGELGVDAALTVLAGALQVIGNATEFSGEQVDRFGELMGQGASILRNIRDRDLGGGGAEEETQG